MKRWHLIFLLILALLAVPFWWLMIEGEPPPARADARIDMSELRRLAESEPGEGPRRIDSYVTAVWGTTGNRLAAGTGFKPVQLSAIGHVLGYEDGAPIVIDSGLTREGARARGATHFSPRHREELDTALKRARAIAITDAGGDHLGALTSRASLAPLARRLMLGEAQRAQMNLSGWPAAARDRISVLPHDEASVIGPGVVSFAAPGIKPDSRMIYVRLANGREALFTGDNAVQRRVLTSGKLPARLFSQWISPIDRAATGAWLMELQRLQRSHPDLVIVTGHDASAQTAAFRETEGDFGGVHFGLSEKGMFIAP